MKILGILNLSEDSFSDGGRYSQLDAAIHHGLHLARCGAWAVDVGAVSSHPDAADLPARTELARLRPVLAALKQAGVRVSVDTFASGVQAALAHEVDVLNDIRGFPEPSIWPVLAEASCDLVVMHAVQDGRADRREVDPHTVVERMLGFFEHRVQGLLDAGIDAERLVLDPGMGFFLGRDPQNSVAVLQSVARLRSAFGLPVLISVSRKSFLAGLLGEDRPPLARGGATLAAELFAVSQGASWIRTHDVGQLADAHRVSQAWLPPSARTTLEGSGVE